MIIKRGNKYGRVPTGPTHNDDNHTTSKGHRGTANSRRRTITLGSGYYTGPNGYYTGPNGYFTGYYLCGFTSVTTTAAS